MSAYSYERLKAVRRLLDDISNGYGRVLTAPCRVPATLMRHLKTAGFPESGKLLYKDHEQQPFRSGCLLHAPVWTGKCFRPQRDVLTMLELQKASATRQKEVPLEARQDVDLCLCPPCEIQASQSRLSPPSLIPILLSGLPVKSQLKNRKSPSPSQEKAATSWRKPQGRQCG